ncbi:MAG: hypothetical protein AAF211_32455 [Myxococcota bacterium]
MPAIHAVVRAERRRVDRTIEIGIATLRERVRAYDDVGVAPSLMDLLGDPAREVPYNTALGWLCDPVAGHGAGRAVSRALAARADHAPLVAELDAGVRLGVLVETGWPAAVGAYGVPDLVLSTENCVLLIENKVHAGESRAPIERRTLSGVKTRGQYPLYLDGAERLRAEGRDVRLVLTSRDARALPDGWDVALTHAQVADLLDDVAREDDLSEWGRVCCRVVAEALRPDRRVDVDLAEARRLLERACDDRLTFRDAQRITQLAESLPAPLSPWSRE